MRVDTHDVVVCVVSPDALRSKQWRMDVRLVLLRRVAVARFGLTWFGCPSCCSQAASERFTICERTVVLLFLRRDVQVGYAVDRGKCLVPVLCRDIDMRDAGKDLETIGWIPFRGASTLHAAWLFLLPLSLRGSRDTCGFPAILSVLHTELLSVWRRERRQGGCASAAPSHH